MELSLTDVCALLDWYLANRRDLPWRDTGDPYDVWLSEIMLQQTRVEFVKERFVQFRQKLPTIQDLAECPEDDLMKLWEGMGYYSRARNLQKCAQVLVKQYHGILPSDRNALLKLPGIGPYTAGAIASIAYGMNEPAVDGNVLRVAARLFNDARDIRKPEIREEIQNCFRTFLNHHKASLQKKYASDTRTPASLFSQAWMELGALICVPSGAPHCENCPLNRSCAAFLNQTTSRIPYRSPLKERTIVHRTVTVIRDGSRFLLHKRPSGGLLGGLYEFPGYEESLSRSALIRRLEQDGISPVKVTELPDSRHIFSHVEWHMKAYEVLVGSQELEDKKDCVLLTKKELQRFAVPSAFHTYKAYYAWSEPDFSVPASAAKERP
ncbi:MAG: A/G-specific adenine glycosylase [Solobacterium sp.]|nr:A/G-specific adenine glycosylase [Solobacterium sp.]